MWGVVVRKGLKLSAIVAGAVVAALGVASAMSAAAPRPEAFPNSGNFQIESTSQSGMCASASTGRIGGTIALAACNSDDTDQLWTHSRGQLVSVGASTGDQMMCATARTFGPMNLSTCDRSPGQLWTQLTSGQIRETTVSVCWVPNGTNVGTATCTFGDSTQDWTVIPSNSPSPSASESAPTR
jgi:hypothetical protein